MDRALLEAYYLEAGDLRQAVAGLSRAECQAKPADGSWSIQQIVHHTLQSDLIASDRMFRIIAEEKPQLIGFDETSAEQRLPVERLEMNLMCELFERNRQLTYTLLAALPDETFTRQGLHNERGPLTLAQMVASYVQHLRHHLAFIRNKRPQR